MAFSVVARSRSTVCFHSSASLLRASTCEEAGGSGGRGSCGWKVRKYNLCRTRAGHTAQGCSPSDAGTPGAAGVNAAADARTQPALPTHLLQRQAGQLHGQQVVVGRTHGFRLLAALVGSRLCAATGGGRGRAVSGSWPGQAFRTFPRAAAAAQAMCGCLVRARTCCSAFFWPGRRS